MMWHLPAIDDYRHFSFLTCNYPFYPRGLNHIIIFALLYISVFFPYASPFVAFNDFVDPVSFGK